MTTESDCYNMASFHPHLLHRGSVIFHRLACQCVFVLCLRCVPSSGRGPFILSFCCLSFCVSRLMGVIDMQQCILGSYRRACSHGYCVALWLIRHRDIGPWTQINNFVYRKTFYRMRIPLYLNLYNILNDS